VAFRPSSTTARELALAARIVAGYALWAAVAFMPASDDYHRACDAILRITGHAELLDDSPVIRKSIALRNPYTDVLNLIQLELLRRQQPSGRALRPTPTAAEDEGEGRAETDTGDGLAELLFLSINGIAAATQTTG
jgi:phosphoenolpyruvate carboxylase